MKNAYSVDDNEIGVFWMCLRDATNLHGLKKL